MALDLDGTYPYKHSIVDEFFVKTADDNYVAARWCFLESLNVDFFWLAVHCLEKYLKAALLMNELSAKSYSHRIVDLYEAVKPLAPDLMPSLLRAPAQWGNYFWYDETPELFMRRLYKNGQAANRYQLVGYVLQGEDLFKLDQMVFAVRRLCQRLDAHFLGRKRPNIPDQSIRDRMLLDTDSWKLRSKLEEFIEGKHGAKLQHVLLNWNFLFAPASYTHTQIDLHFASRKPVLVRRIIEPIDAGPKAAAEADLIWQWVQDNIDLPKGYVPSMNSTRAARKAKKPGP